MGKKGQSSQVCHYLVFTLSGERFGLPLDSVQRVVRAVAVTILPKAPEIVRGLINYKGNILPVINMSRRFNLAEMEIQPNHNFIIVHTARRKFVLVADLAEGVITRPKDDIVTPAGITAGMEFLAGVIKLENGMMLVPDLEHLLTHDEEQMLQSLVQDKQKSTKKSQKVKINDKDKK